MKKPQRWIKSIAISLALVIFIFLMYSAIIGIISSTNHKLAVKSYDNTGLRYQYNLNINDHRDNDQIRSDLERLFDVKCYKYKERLLDSQIGGHTFLVIRLIEINSDYVDMKHLYTFILAHEFTHLKYYTVNECFTEYKALEILYNSDDIYFKNIAIWYGSNIIKNNEMNEYDCGYYLIELLHNELIKEEK